MDPLSTSVGLLASIAQLSVYITKFVRGVRDARQDMEAVSRELTSLELCLEMLRDDCADPKMQYPTKAKKLLTDIMTDCERVTQQMMALLQRLSTDDTVSRVRWTLTASSDMDKLRSTLAAQKSAIDIALEMWTLSVATATKENTSIIRRQTEDIKVDTSTILEEVSQLRLQVTALERNGVGSSLHLRKFLDETEDYAEAILEQDDPGPAQAKFLLISESRDIHGVPQPVMIDSAQEESRVSRSLTEDRTSSIEPEQYRNKELESLDSNPLTEFSLGPKGNVLQLNRHGPKVPASWSSSQLSPIGTQPSNQSEAPTCVGNEWTCSTDSWIDYNRNNGYSGKLDTGNFNKMAMVASDFEKEVVPSFEKEIVPTPEKAAVRDSYFSSRTAIEEKEVAAFPQTEGVRDSYLSGRSDGTMLSASDISMPELIKYQPTGRTDDVAIQAGSKARGRLRDSERNKLDRELLKLVKEVKNLSKIRTLLDQGANSNASGPRNTVLTTELQYGKRHEAVELLLRRGANPNATTDGVPAYEILDEGNMQRMRSLLPSSKSVDAVPNCVGILYLAAVHSDIKMVKLLLEYNAMLDAGAVPGIPPRPMPTTNSDSSLKSPSTYERKGSVTSGTGGHTSALLAAAEANKWDIAQLLADLGADPNIRGGKYDSALQIASAWNQRELVQRLVDSGADVNANGGFYGSSLIAASHEGCLNLVKLLLDRGAAINYIGTRFGTALAAAIRQGHQDIVKELLKRGADTKINYVMDIALECLKDDPEDPSRKAIVRALDLRKARQAPKAPQRPEYQGLF